MKKRRMALITSLPVVALLITAGVVAAAGGFGIRPWIFDPTPEPQVVPVLPAPSLFEMVVILINGLLRLQPGAGSAAPAAGFFRL